MESIEHLVANLNTDYWEEGVMEWARAQTQAAVALLIKRRHLTKIWLKIKYAFSTLWVRVLRCN